jgi:hypothetical protein
VVGLRLIGVEGRKDQNAQQISLPVAGSSLAGELLRASEARQGTISREKASGVYAGTTIFSSKSVVNVPKRRVFGRRSPGI